MKIESEIPNQSYFRHSGKSLPENPRLKTGTRNLVSQYYSVLQSILAIKYDKTLLVA